MPTTSRTRSAGLSGADLDGLRSAVDAGRRPKVVFTPAAGQIAGQQGQVIRLDDPSADEWVVVRFGRDELPFAPGDLQLAPKAARKRAVNIPKPVGAPSSTVVTPSVPQQLSVPDGPRAATAPVSSASRLAAPIARTVEPAPTGRPSVSALSATAPSDAASKPSAAPVGAVATPVKSSAAAAGPTAGTSAPQAAAAPAARPARKSARKSPELTVTLGHHEGRWTVQAAKGTRILVKPTSVRPADALKMVALLDAPGVTDVVAEIVEAARAEAEQIAERLRRELAEVEATLADLED
jgi:hypothetical protein